MAVAGSAGAVVVAAVLAAYSLLSGYQFSADDVSGASSGTSRVQFTGGIGGKRDQGEAISGADFIGETSGSGDVDQSWAFMPVALSCIASCPAVECVCSCDRPEPKVSDICEERGWRELFVQPAVHFSWLFCGTLCGLCGLCSARQRSIGEAAPPLSPARSNSSYHASDVSSPDRRRSEALRSLHRQGRLA